MIKITLGDLLSLIVFIFSFAVTYMKLKNEIIENRELIKRTQETTKLYVEKKITEMKKIVDQKISNLEKKVEVNTKDLNTILQFRNVKK